MPHTSADNRTTTGLVWLFFGAIFLFGAIPIARPVIVSESDPGPRALPLCLSFVLLVGGITQIAMRRRGPPASTRQSRGESQVERPPATHSRLAAAFFISLWLYLGFIWLIGFVIATLLYSTLAMRALGTRWITAGIVSSFLVAAIYLLFEIVFTVVLPVGWIWG